MGSIANTICKMKLQLAILTVLSVYLVDGKDTQWWGVKVEDQFPIPDKCSVSVNGCGGAGMDKIAQFLPFAQILKGTCNKHDACYGCGAMHGWTQKQCDDSFLIDMKTQCNHTFGKWWDTWRKNHCHWKAHLFHATVRALGAGFFKSKSGSYCSATCAKDYGKP